VRRPAPNRVAVRIDHPRGSAWESRLRRRGREFLRRLELGGTELSVSLVTDVAIRRLNRAWRGKDRPTDVLSFSVGTLPGGAPGPKPLGDVVISLDTAARRARAEGLKTADELDRYLAHGLLHLLGHDHHRRTDAQRMARAEAALLGKPGMVG
jgi:probable rRNA maturation factor